jgi:hypothetical protein
MKTLQDRSCLAQNTLAMLRRINRSLIFHAFGTTIYDEVEATQNYCFCDRSDPGNRINNPRGRTSYIMFKFEKGGQTARFLLVSILVFTSRQLK